jgi:hypothetical protein
METSNLKYTLSSKDTLYTYCPQGDIRNSLKGQNVCSYSEVFFIQANLGI